MLINLDTRKLKEAMVKRELAPEKVAAALGVSWEKFQPILSGEVQPTQWTLNKLCKCLGVSKYDLMKGYWS